MDDLLSSLCLPRMSRQLIEAFCNPDLNAERVAKIVEANPYYVELLRGFLLHRSGPAAEVPGDLRVEAMLVRLGMQSSRDFLIAAQARRSTGRAGADRAGWSSLDASSVLRFALRAEAEAAQIHGEISTLAFAGGLVFDLLALQMPSSRGSDLAADLPRLFERGLKAAQIAVAAGRRVPRFKQRRALFAATLLESFGGTLARALHPDLARFESLCESKGMPRLVIEHAIVRKYGARPAVLASLAASAIGVLGAPAARALAHTQEPYLLRGESEADYLLSGTIRLASNIARRPMRVQSEQDPQLAQWCGPELAELGIGPSELVELSGML